MFLKGEESEKVVVQRARVANEALANAVQFPAGDLIPAPQLRRAFHLLSELPSVLELVTLSC